MARTDNSMDRAVRLDAARRIIDDNITAHQIEIDARLNEDLERARRERGLRFRLGRLVARMTSR